MKDNTMTASNNNGSCLETLKLPHVSSCEMLTFCDVLHEAKQKKHKQTLESSQ